MGAKEKKVIAFPVYPGVTPLDLVGPLTILRNMRRTPYRTVVVGTGFRSFPPTRRCGSCRTRPSLTSPIRGP